MPHHFLLLLLCLYIIIGVAVTAIFCVETWLGWHEETRNDVWVLFLLVFIWPLVIWNSFVYPSV
jgi:hypothetical protein